MKCKTCMYWQKDYGTWTATGWTGRDKDVGDCALKPEKVRKSGNDFCSYWLEDHLTRQEDRPSSDEILRHIEAKNVKELIQTRSSESPDD